MALVQVGKSLFFWSFPMPRQFLMSWCQSTKRWAKKYKGQMYFISCRQLGVQPTKYGSWQAANDWWAKKQAEIDDAAGPVLDTASRQVANILERTPVEALRTLAERGAAAKKLLNMLDTAALPEPLEAAAAGLLEGKGLKPLVVDAYLTDGKDITLDDENRNRSLAELAATVAPGTPANPERTVEAQSRSWVEWQHTRHVAGEISAGRWDAYARNLGVFVAWIGGDTVVDELNWPTLQAYYKHLATKKAEGLYALDYCKNLLGAVKNFVTYLAETNVVPLPGNLRRLRFVAGDDDEDKTPPHFTVEEVRELLAACHSDRTKLMILLMLNCGMYQNDIAELRDKEVDWKAGTITRKRSKRRRGGYKVKYPLWPETFELLKRFKSGKDRVLLSEEGNPLVSYQADGEKLKRYDLVREAYERVAKRVNQSKSLMVFRKTSANLLDGHKDYRHFSLYFLAHSPKSVKDKSYTTPNDTEFAVALKWLRSQLLS